MNKETLIKHLKAIGLFSAFILILIFGHYLFVVNPEIIVYVLSVIYCIVLYMVFYMVANN
jgi:hypothetical protein